MTVPGAVPASTVSTVSAPPVTAKRGSGHAYSAVPVTNTAKRESADQAAKRKQDSVSSANVNSKASLLPAKGASQSFSQPARAQTVRSGSVTAPSEDPGYSVYDESRYAHIVLLCFWCIMLLYAASTRTYDAFGIRCVEL